MLEPTPYRALRVLGRGKYGTVYAVEHEFLGKVFALKVLHARLASKQMLDRVRLEAQAMARLRHPNVVQVVDFWTAPNGLPCVVMELLKGQTLAHELEDRVRLPEHEAVNLARQLLRPLAEAHALGIVHRDLTPDNLFLHEVPEQGRVLKVLDFGLARVLPNMSELAPHPLADRTRTGAAVGSPRYMSPEGARGERVDHRADLYSVGMILYEMLVGHGPFDAGFATLLPPSHYLDSPLSPPLDELVLQALHERLEHRYQSAADFLEALDTVGTWL